MIAPDLPGFGRSPRAGRAVSYEAYADVLAGILDGLGIARGHVAGLSMGGGIALTLAARHPERVRALVLMAPTGCPDVSLPRLACNRIVEFAEQLTSPAHAHGKALVARTFAANLLRHPASLMATVRMVASRNIVEEARRITAPTLLLWGERDRTIPPRLAPQFADRLPRRDPARHARHAFTRWRRRDPRTPPAIIHDFISRRAGLSAPQRGGAAEPHQPRRGRHREQQDGQEQSVADARGGAQVGGGWRHRRRRTHCP